MNVPKAKRARPKGFTHEEATAILRTAKAITSNAGWGKVYNIRARRWIPWICAHTGARVGEIAQLRKEDFKETNGMGERRIYEMASFAGGAPYETEDPLRVDLEDGDFGF